MIFSVNLLYKFNVMKSLQVLLVAVLATVSTSIFAQNSITSAAIDITINGQTTREQLAQLNKDMRAQGINFTYIPQFDNERRLMSLQYKVLASDNSIIGTGGHEALQTAGAAVHFHVDVASKNFNETKK